MKTLLALCALSAVFYIVTAAPVSKKPKNQGLQPMPPPVTGQDEMKPPPQPKPPTEGEDQEEDQESDEETEKETSGPGEVGKPIPEEEEEEQPGSEGSSKETSGPGKIGKPLPEEEEKEQPGSDGSSKETSGPGKIGKPLPEEEEKEQPGSDGSSKETSGPGEIGKPIPEEEEKEQPKPEGSSKETSGPGEIGKPIPEEEEKEQTETEDVEKEKESSEGGDEDEKEIDLTKLDSVDPKKGKGPQSEKDEDAEEKAELNPDFFEGDLKLTKDEIEKIKGNTVSKKDAVASALRKWPNAQVPIAATRLFDQSRIDVLLEAIKEFHDKTCVRFVNKKATDKNYILFTKDEGCYSTEVGKNRNAALQTISIGDRCNYKGTVIHELMHALGFFHEHTRLDRDQFVTIQWGNIEYRRESQFQKYQHGEGDYLNEPYDYDSVMHYPRDGFGVVVNGRALATIVPKDKPFRKIGQRNGFSEIDLRQINKLYKCTKFTSKY